MRRFARQKAASCGFAPLLGEATGRLNDRHRLGYGMLHCGLPTAATVTGHAAARVERWYGFVDMQHRVVRRLPTLTVSRASGAAIGRERGVPEDRIHVVPLTAGTRIFRPRPEIRRVRVDVGHRPPDDRRTRWRRLT